MLTVANMITREIRHRIGSFILGVIAVGLAIGALAGTVAHFHAYAQETETTLNQKQRELNSRLAKLDADISRAMLHLGFNITLLPQGQTLDDFYSDDYATMTFSEQTPATLAATPFKTMGHLVPRLRRKIRWPEKDWTVIVVGTSKDILHPMTETKDMVLHLPPAGQAILGSEISRALGFRPGDMCRIMERDLTVSSCLPPTGSRDDITIWLTLSDAQAVLKTGAVVNEVLAVETRLAWSDPAQVQAEISAILPDVRVIENHRTATAKTHARTRVTEQGLAAIHAAEAQRTDWEQATGRIATLLVPSVMVLCLLWLGLLMQSNVRERQTEIGICRTIGFHTNDIVLLFLGRALAIGALGGLIGCLTAGLVGTASVRLCLMSILLAMIIAAVAAIWPTVYAAREDPADILVAE